MIKIELIEIGQYLPINLKKFIKKLNSIQNSFHFYSKQENINIDTNLQPKYNGLFFNSNDIFSSVLKNSTNTDDLKIAIGAISIVHIEDENIENNIDIEEYEWFGVWQNNLCPINQKYNNIGLISLKQWMQNYEQESYRTNEQYLCHMIIAFIGDILYSGKLTHADFRWCIFDLNDDMHSISESVKKCNLSQGVQEIILKEKPIIQDVSGTQILESFNRMAKFVRQPNISSIFRFLNENAITQFFIIGILLANSLNPLLTVANGSIFSSGLMGIIFISIFFYLRHKPYGKLK